MQKPEHWTEIENSEELNQLNDRSGAKPLGIFKHSTRCGISTVALRKMLTDEQLLSGIELRYVDVIGNRAISNAIESKYSVKHESPQFLLIVDGKCVYSSSHEAIEPGTIAAVI